MTLAGGWAAFNQDVLARELDRVRVMLESLVDDSLAAAGSAPNVDPARQAETPRGDTLPRAGSGDVPDALDTLCTIFGLTPFERDSLLLCAGVEMDGRFGALLGRVHPEAGGVPTFATTLALLPGPHWSAVTPSGPLRAWRLIEVSTGDVIRGPLRIDERILHFLAGASCADERLRGLVTPLVAAPVPSYQESDVATVHRLLDGATRGDVVQIVTQDRAAGLRVAAGACASLEAPALVLRSADIPSQPAQRADLARLAGREALLTGALLVVEIAEPADAAAIGSFAAQSTVPVLLVSPTPLRLPDDIRTTIVDLHRPTTGERLEEWRVALGPAADRLNGELGEMCAQFDLDASTVHAVASMARQRSGEAGLAQALWDGSRAASRARMDGLAQRIEAIATWDDLVLPAAQTQTLRDIARDVRHRHLVYEEWGFADKSTRGLGITAMFTGPSGTGKTMAAEVLARDLGLDLYRIDLAGIVSKYIGETEKNLKQVFDTAEGSGAVLLFDEADALFGKRSEVKDSHDRYANIEVSYLLQRMEAYRGLAILTTNQKQAVDAAFLRRIRFIVSFPFPDREQRMAIWQRVFPARTPVGDLDYARLAQLNVAGGHIRNIALSGAFLAAEKGEPVSMALLADAARAEYAKLERPLADAEIRGW